jgi:hypothetical protein
MLIGISTPYRKTGFCIKSTATTSCVWRKASDGVIAAQRAADPTAVAAEWDAEFMTDIGAFLDDELIEAAIERGRPLELSPFGPRTDYRAHRSIRAAGSAATVTASLSATRNERRRATDATRRRRTLMSDRSQQTGRACLPRSALRQYRDEFLALF